MKLGRTIFVLVVLFFKSIDCNVIPNKKTAEKLSLNSEPERKRFVRQSGPEVWAVNSGAGRNNLVGFLEEDTPVPIADSINPLEADADVAFAGNTKEKRCRQRYEPVLGSNPTHDGPNLHIVRRDVPMDTIRKRCENCRNSPKCKNLGLCELCERICKQFVDPATMSAIDQTMPSNRPEVNDQRRDAMLIESLTDWNDSDSTLVAMPQRQLDTSLHSADGLSDVDDRFYTVGSFGPGPVQSLLARLLRINDKSKLERLIVLAKTVSTLKPHHLDKPVVIDTAHVFTLNDGKPSPVEMELHPVDADKDIVELTRRLNEDLDTAMEHKRKHHGKTNVHLSAKEIDKIIQKAIETDSAEPLDTGRVGEANPSSDNNSEEVGSEKKGKYDNSDKQYYSNQPMYHEGYYRKDDSDEELDPTDRTIAEDELKSISTRHRGFDEEGIEDAHSDNLRKQGKGNKEHHVTDSDSNLQDVVGAAKQDDANERIIHAKEEHKAVPVTSNSRVSENDKLVQNNTHHDKPSSKEEDSKESGENDQERHTGKKGKKHKKGGGYYGGYRDAAAEDNEQIGDDVQNYEELSITSKAKSNFDAPMQDQIQYQAPDQQNHQEEHDREPQYHEEASHQYELSPALPNSYQPEEGYDQQDNYKSEETYYSDSSEEYVPESYDQQVDNEGYHEEENQGYGAEEPQQEARGYQHPESYQQHPQQYGAPQQYQESQPLDQKPQKAEQQHNQQQVYQLQPQEQRRYKPQTYPQAQNPVYSHPAPPVEQGTYVPKKPQYNEEAKMLPTAPEGKKQYPISQAQEPEQERAYDQGYEQGEDGEGYDESPSQQEIIIPSLNVDEVEEDYLLGNAKNKDVKGEDEIGKANNQLADEYSKILRADLTQGVKFANKTAEIINKRIDEIVEESKNLTDKQRMAQLDETEKAIDDPLVGDNNLKQFRARFDKAKAEEGSESHVTDPIVGAVLENEHGRFAAMKKPLLESKHLAEKIIEPIIGMANVPSESKSPPFVDPKAMAHQVELAKMMRDKNPERVGCKHKEDSSEEYYSPGNYRREHNQESKKEDGKQEKSVTGDSEDTVGCKKKKKDKDSEEYIMVYPQQHGYGGYRENEENSDRKLKPTDETQNADDTVGCKKKKDKESKEEMVYIHPPVQYNSYGGYRENEEASDRKPQHKIIVQPNALTNEAIEDRLVGLEQPGPSGPFTDEPIDIGAADDTVGCKKKKKDKDSGEEYSYVYPPQPHYNEYGGYRENAHGSDRKKPLEKVKEVLEGIVHPTAAKAEKRNQSVVQNVKEMEDTTELPKAILPALIEGFKQLRNHHNEEAAKINKAKIELESSTSTSTTEAGKDNFVAPPPVTPSHTSSFSPELSRPGLRQSKIVPPQQFNGPRNQLQHQFMPPPPANFGTNMRRPIEDHLATLEAFHNQQNQQQQFFPIVGAAQPSVDPQMNHGHNKHQDMNFGKMITADTSPDKMFGVENREVNEKTQMFFVGDGIKLPIHVKKQEDGTMHLSIDVGKLCQCNNVTCTNAVEGLANLVPTLEKLNHGKVELEVNEDSFNSALNNLHNMEDRGRSDKRQRFSDKSKRSPQVTTTKPSDSGELVPVFDDEQYDEISPIRKYYTGNLADDLYNLKDNIQKYYENEDQFKEYMSAHRRNNGFFTDEFITKRVGLLTNVLSWMKSIAIDEARQQHHVEE